MKREALIKHWDVIQAFKEGKTIQYYDTVDKCWYIAYEPSFRLDMILRIKPEQTKRLPTIEEVEKWFLDNMVFIHKKTNVFCRIERVDKSGWEEQVVYIYNEWFTLNTFCKEHTHYDGSELYITEN